MKLASTLLLLVLFVSAQASVLWAGTWNTHGGPEGHCSPASPVVIHQAQALTVTWTWENSEACEEFGIAGQAVTNTLPIPSGNCLDLAVEISGNPVNGQLMVSDDLATFESIDGSVQIFFRDTPVNWAGTWSAFGSPSGHCSPASPVTLTQSGNTVTASWTWENSETCQQMGLAGTSFTGTILAPAGNSIDLAVQAGTNFIDGQLVMNNPNEVTFTGADGSIQIFSRSSSAEF